MSNVEGDTLSVGVLADGRVFIMAWQAGTGNTTELRMPPARARQIAALMVAASEQSETAHRVTTKGREA